MQAAETANLSRTALYDWRKDDPDFAADWEIAFEKGVDALEAEAFKRAFAGSDTLLIFLLKGNKSAKYKDRVQSEISGPGGGPIQISDEEATKELANLMAQLNQRLDHGDDLA